MKSRLKKLITCVSLCIIGSICCSISTYAGTLPVIRYAQEQSNWCWAASMQMILRYRTGTYYSQPSICLNTMGASVNVGANVTQVASGLRTIGGISASGSYSSLSLSAAQGKINSKIPFYVGLTWNGGGGHATVCSGYSGSSLQIIDPSGSAATTYFAYSTMVTNCNFKSGTGKWDHGVY